MFRTLFEEDPHYNTEEEEELADKYRSHVTYDLVKQKVVVRGMDRESHAIVLVFPRTCPEMMGDECFIDTQLYMIEHAIACTEVLSDGREDQIVVVLNFGELKSSCTPPMSAIKYTRHFQ